MDIIKLRKTIEKIVTKHNISNKNNIDILERYNLLNEIESKCRVLINDEPIMRDGKLSMDEFINIVYEELIKDKNI